MPNKHNGSVFKWQPHIPLLPPVVNDDVDNNYTSIFKSVASNDDAVSILIYAGDDASFRSDHTYDGNNDQVLRANNDEDGDVVVIVMMATSMMRMMIPAAMTSVMGMMATIMATR